MSEDAEHFRALYEIARKERDALADAIEAVQQLGRHGVTGGTIGQQLTLLHQ